MSNTQSRIQEVIYGEYPINTDEIIKNDPNYTELGAEEQAKENRENRYHALRGAEIALENQWVRVEDKTPPNRTCVIAYDKHAGHMVSEYKHGCFFDGLNQLKYVTHWAELLPTPPNK